MLSKRSHETLLNPNTASSATQRLTVLILTFFFSIFVFGSLRKAILSEELDYYYVFSIGLLVSIWYGISLLLP